MAYGKVKVNTLTYDTGGGDTDVTISTLTSTAELALKANIASPTFTGDVSIAAEGDLRLVDSGSNYVAFEAPSTVTTSYTLEFPATVGTTGKVLKSTVAGQVATMSWETDSATDSTKMPLAGGTFTGNVDLGVNNTGVDCKFFGATAGDYLLWDESANSLLTGGGATVDIAQDKLKIDGTAVTATAAELNILDGVTSDATELNILDGVTSNATELNLLDGKTVVGDAVLASDQTWSGSQRGAIYDATSDAATAGALWAIDFDDGNNQKVTLVSTNLLSVIPTNQTVGQSGSIFITQPGSPLSLGWHADWKWAGGVANAPSLTQTGGATDRLDYVILAANTIHAVLTLAVA